jgi:hypothetical protein
MGILGYCLGLSFLIFITVALLSPASTRKSRQIRRQRIQTLTRPLALLSITEAFDHIYAILWES